MTYDADVIVVGAGLAGLVAAELAPNDATTTKWSPSTIGAESIVERSLPDLCSVVTSSMKGLPGALPKIRPFETLKAAR
jgi:flavin-dependent dehydrogenase